MKSGFLCERFSVISSKFSDWIISRSSSISSLIFSPLKFEQISLITSSETFSPNLYVRYFFTSSFDNGLKLIIQHLDLIVGRIGSRLWVSRINKISSRGSSKIFNNAFWDSVFNFSAWDIITNLFLISGVDMARFDFNSRIKSIVISFALGSWILR
jgi:hypothetical protein